MIRIAVVPCPSSFPTETFVSAKTVRPVPCHGDLARLALIRATLDPEVVSIAPVDAIVDGARARRRPLATLVGVDGRVALCVQGEDGPDAPDPNGTELVYSAIDLLSYPLAANLRLVWSCARRWVSPGDQVRVLHVLEEYGSASLIEAAQAATASVDGVATVLAMACRCLVEIDLDNAPLGPGTRVRRRDA